MMKSVVFPFAVAAMCLLSSTMHVVEGFGMASISTTRKVSSRSSTTSPLHALKGDEDDFPQQGREDEYTGDVDWDAEWKKVMEKEKTGENIDRPGKDFYKSDAEIAAIRAANKAQNEVSKISTNLPSAPDMSSLTGDWKFWIGILAIISVASAVLSAPPSYDAISGGGSYYI